MLMNALSNDGRPLVLQLDRGAIIPAPAEHFPSGTKGQPNGYVESEVKNGRALFPAFFCGVWSKK
jgi:hypothetical protein